MASRSITKSAFAREVGVTPQAIDKLLKLGVITQRADGKLDHAAVLKQWEEHRARRAPNMSDPGQGQGDKGESWAEAKRRKEVFSANIVELEYRQRAKELVAVADVQKLLYNATRRVRERLETMPARMAPVVCSSERPQDECHRALEAEVNHVLDELAEMSMDDDDDE